MRLDVCAQIYRLTFRFSDFTKTDRLIKEPAKPTTISLLRTDCIL
jgi:hypothetical protein